MEKIKVIDAVNTNALFVGEGEGGLLKIITGEAIGRKMMCPLCPLRAHLV